MLYQFDKTGPANFVHSADSRYLYGTAYQTGVSNVFRYDTKTQNMEAVTNCKTGYFRPVPVSGDSLIVFHYGSDGFTPAMIADATLEDVNAVQYLGNAVAEKHPVVKKWNPSFQRS
jgi:Tol biopolymer transport system component